MVLKNKKYTYWDFFSEVFRIAPVESALQLMLSVIHSLVPSITVFTTASFVDTAVAIFRNEQATVNIVLPILIILAIAVYGYKEK